MRASNEYLNICFRGEIRKKSILLVLKKTNWLILSYEEGLDWWSLPVLLPNQLKKLIHQTFQVPCTQVQT